MSPIEEQKKILDQVYWLLKSSVSTNSETATCTIQYDRFEDGSSSIGGKAAYTTDGKITHCLLKYPDRSILSEVIPRLHSLMKAHTGGDWNALTLTINRDGSVTTKFEYPEQAQKA